MVDAIIIIPILWMMKLRHKDAKCLAQRTRVVSGGCCLRTLGRLAARGLFLPIKYWSSQKKLSG